jgi:hypothetical protein
MAKQHSTQKQIEGKKKSTTQLDANCKEMTE